MRRRYYYLPAALIVGLFLALPSLTIIGFSVMHVTSRNLAGPWTPTMANFAAVVTSRTVRDSFFRTIEIAVIAVSVELLLGSLAGIALANTRLSTITERLVPLPMFASPLTVGILWKLLFTAEGGVVNGLLAILKFQPVQWLSVAPFVQKPLWLSSTLAALNANLATSVVILADIWQWTPFVALVVAARVRAVPISLRDAARVDGLSDKRFVSAVLLPLLRPTLIVLTCIRIVDALKVFDVVWVLFGNSVATATASVSIVEFGLGIRDFGRAAAASLLLLLCSTAIVGVALRYARR